MHNACKSKHLNKCLLQKLEKKLKFKAFIPFKTKPPKAIDYPSNTYYIEMSLLIVTREEIVNTRRWLL
jgi:hypothetical protein